MPLYGPPKRGKARANDVPKAIQRKKAKESKPGAKIPYVRVKQAAAPRKVRGPVATPGSFFLTGTELKVIKELTKSGFLPSHAEGKCPSCNTGTLGGLAWSAKNKCCGYTCRSNACRKMVAPHSGHPIFATSMGQSYVSLQSQAFILFNAVHGASMGLVRQLTGHSEKLIGRVFTQLDAARAAYVEKKEGAISFGGNWEDVEADEVDLGKHIVSCRKEGKVKWEQWGGVVQRGRPATLVLSRLHPNVTVKRAPGPGPIKLEEWMPFATNRLRGKQVILHTDGARAYRAQLPGVIHDAVIHQTKKLVGKDGKPVKKNGRFVWVKPKYAKVFKHKLPGGKTVKVVGGTQIIDRFWRTLREHLKNRPKVVGSATLRRRVRSCQWAFWQRGQDPWAATGAMLREMRVEGIAPLADE